MYVNMLQIDTSLRHFLTYSKLIAKANLGSAELRGDSLTGVSAGTSGQVI